VIKPQHHAVVVIGAGIAGAAIANALLEQGQAVCVVDAAAGPATACSSHAYAIAHPHIGRGSARLLRLTRIAFLLAEAQWGASWNQHGIFQPSKKDKSFKRAEVAAHLQALELDESIAIALEAKDAEQICGIKQSGVWLPRGASMSLADASKKLLEARSGLRTYWNQEITQLERNNSHWLLLNKKNETVLSADKVVIAAGAHTKLLIDSLKVRLPLRPVRGQLSIFSVAKNSPWVQELPSVGISGDGYCLPAQVLEDGQCTWMVGSSYDEGEDDPLPRQSSDQFNREQAKALLNFAQGNLAELESCGSFVGIRCVAGDRLPIIGPLSQRPGIFIASAFGSRGVLWSALSAKLITAQVLDDAALLARLGLTADLLAALDPVRFLAGAAPSALGALASNSKPIFPSGPSAR
jgi:tRNA 5-methylaminomethyl-2-thiouridine biosynthesis bifunctional protein